MPTDADTYVIRRPYIYKYMYMDYEWKRMEEEKRNSRTWILESPRSEWSAGHKPHYTVYNRINGILCRRMHCVQSANEFLFDCKHVSTMPHGISSSESTFDFDSELMSFSIFLIRILFSASATRFFLGVGYVNVRLYKQVEIEKERLTPVTSVDSEANAACPEIHSLVDLEPEPRAPTCQSV